MTKGHKMNFYKHLLTLLHRFKHAILTRLIKKNLLKSQVQNSILFASLPKSGTVFTSETIARSLTIPYKSDPGFPDKEISENILNEFTKYPAIHVSHLSPSTSNQKKLLEANINKIILHIRDPRAAMISWYHFIEKWNTDEREHTMKGAPKNYYQLSKKDKNDVLIDTFYQYCLKWIQDWMDIYDKNTDFKILLMTHDDLLVSTEHYCNKVFDFYNVSAPVIELKKDSKTHFRSGKKTEWIEHLTAEQINRMDEMMPDELRKRFGWEKGSDILQSEIAA
jgi:hypothetical protein